MENIKLSVEKREGRGKGVASRLRRSGKVPGVFYGSDDQPISISVNTREFEYKVGHLEGSHLIEFLSPLPDLNEKVSLLKEVQRHPVTAFPLHIDFYAVAANKPIEVEVPIHFIGEPVGVKISEGILSPILREIKVECLPRYLPGAIEVDVSELDISDVIHIADLPLPDGVTVLHEDEEAVVTVSPPTVVEEPEEAVEEGVEAAEEAETQAEGESTPDEAAEEKNE